MTRARVAAIGLVLVPAIVLAASYCREMVLADRCLDIGGSFNYDNYQCDIYVSHAYVPFAKRNTAMVLCGVLSAGAAVGTAILLMARKE